MGIANIGERTIAKDLVISLTLAVVVFMCIFITIFYVWSSDRVAKEVDLEVEVITGELLGVLALPVYQYDTEFIEQLIHVYQQKHIISKVRVVLLPSQMVVESSDSHLSCNRFSKENILYKGVLVGFVEIDFSDQHLRQEQLLVVKLMFLIVFAIIVIIVAGTFKFVHDNVQLPLHRLLDGITLIADGHYDESEIAVPQKDLGRILEQVQQMGLQIHQKNNMIIEADARYRSIFDGVVEGLFQATIEGKFSAVNASMVRIFGFHSADMMIDEVANIGKDIFVDPADFYNIVSSAEGNGQVAGIELQVYHQTGRKIWIRLSAKVRCCDDGSRVLEGSLQDITELRDLETHLRQSQKMEAVGTMAGGIAHDFNNILTAIMGYTELAQIRATTPELTGDLAEIQKATLRAKDLTAQILTFSRRDEVVVLPIAIAPIVEEALGLILASLPTTIKLHKDITADEFVKIDGTKVHQIVMNLCTNGHQAMLETGGVLGVSLKKVSAEGDALLLGVDLVEGEYLLLEISDTGCGMEEIVKEKIFEPYYSTKKEGHGTGLGLAVVHSIVEGAGGRISVYSLPKMGTSFHVYLPIAEAV